MTTKFIFLFPVYNDWESFEKLVKDIEKNLPNHTRAEIVVVNDCSDASFPETCLNDYDFKKIKSIRVLDLTINMGHQRAIAIGLSEISKNHQADAVIVMDSDGEDRPEDILQMINAYRTSKDHIIVAKRAKRSENFLFVFFWILYKLIFRILTGKTIDFGNFILIPARFLNRIVHMPEVWNSFCAGILRSRIPIKKVSTTRGHRYAGRSKLNFISLIVHGLGNISVFSDMVFSRLLIAVSFIFSLCIIFILSVLAIHLFTELAIPDWATNLIFLLIIILLQSILLLLIGGFIARSIRIHSGNVPRLVFSNYISANKVHLTEKNE